MNGHHLILGRLTDYISGDTLDDTLDERHRQSVGRLLVEQKGYAKAHITPRYALEVRTDNKCARLSITYLVRPSRRIAMLVQYGPGSLVTRHRPALAMSRLVADYQIPVVVVTNGEQADILNGKNGKIMNSGLENIPDLDELTDLSARHAWDTISRKRTEMESRILMAFEVDDRCPCDDSVCTVDSSE